MNTNPTPAIPSKDALVMICTAQEAHPLLENLSFADLLIPLLQVFTTYLPGWARNILQYRVSYRSDAYNARNFVRFNDTLPEAVRGAARICDDAVQKLITDQIRHAAAFDRPARDAAESAARECFQMVCVAFYHTWRAQTPQKTIKVTRPAAPPAPPCPKVAAEPRPAPPPPKAADVPPATPMTLKDVVSSPVHYNGGIIITVNFRGGYVPKRNPCG